jgi:putative multiple sugar transport system permease protein
MACLSRCYHGDLYDHNGWYFISSRNIVNLVNQTGYIAVLAVGMTLVIVIRHIDLSVVSRRVLGAIVAITWYPGISALTAILLVLALGSAGL